MPVNVAWGDVLSPTKEQYLWGTQPSQCPPECSLIQPRCHPEASLSEELWISHAAWAKFPSFTELLFRISIRQTEQRSFTSMLWSPFTFVIWWHQSSKKTWSPQDTCAFIFVDRNHMQLEYLQHFPKSTPTEVDCCLTSYRKTRKTVQVSG